MNNRIWPFVVALLVAGVALVGVRNHLKQREAQLQDQYASGIRVVATRVNLSKGDRIERDHLIPKEVPTRFIPDQAIRGEDAVRTIIGMSVNRDIPANDTLLWTDVRRPDIGGLAAQIPQNERAYTLRVSQGTDTGLIRPNDRVDILGSFALPSKRPEGLSRNVEWQGETETVNIVLLQNVTVLGVGSETTRQSGGGAGGGGGLTIAVTLPESQLLMFASQHGELGVVLRRQEDIHSMERGNLPRITFDAVVDLIGDLDSRRRQRLIEVQRGSSAAEVVPVTPES